VEINSRLLIFFFCLNFSQMKITVLGSRDQLCIHPDVKALENSSDKISVCREKVHRKTCLFHRNFESIQLISSSNVFLSYQ